MRESVGLFRGQRVLSGEWVYGYYVKHDTSKVCILGDDPKTIHYIVWDGFCDWGMEPPLQGWVVDPTTVGECAALVDKNDRLIFEGDVVRCHDLSEMTPDFVGVVDFDSASFVVRDGIVTHYRWDDYLCEVIGNIHDNPKLLEDEE